MNKVVALVLYKMACGTCGVAPDQLRVSKMTRLRLLTACVAGDWARVFTSCWIYLRKWSPLRKACTTSRVLNKRIGRPPKIRASAFTISMGEILMPKSVSCSSSSPQGQCENPRRGLSMPLLCESSTWTRFTPELTYNEILIGSLRIDGYAVWQDLCSSSLPRSGKVSPVVATNLPDSF